MEHIDCNPTIMRCSAANYVSAKRMLVEGVSVCISLNVKGVTHVRLRVYGRQRDCTCARSRQSYALARSASSGYVSQLTLFFSTRSHSSCSSQTSILVAGVVQSQALRPGDAPLMLMVQPVHQQLHGLCADICQHQRLTCTQAAQHHTCCYPGISHNRMISDLANKVLVRLEEQDSQHWCIWHALGASRG